MEDQRQSLRFSLKELIPEIFSPENRSQRGLSERHTATCRMRVQSSVRLGNSVFSCGPFKAKESHLPVHIIEIAPKASKAALEGA